MPTIHRFVVVPALPEKLKALNELAYNLWSLWTYEATNLFSRLDPDTWELTNHNPVRLLSLIPQEKLQVAAEDEGFLSHLQRISAEFHAYMDATTWFKQHHPINKAKVAYFSAEYGLHECLPIYSGGLGILSGDHLKSASDLGLPFCAVGLLYRQGYFRQTLNPDGWQQESYPENDFFTMPITQMIDDQKKPMSIKVEYPNGPVSAYIWKIAVGRINLYLLDTNVPENRPEDREITARLYGGDQDMRVRQELLLGVGGIRALAALGIKPSVCHMNEGHSAFLSLERIRMIMAQENLTFQDARELVAASNVFTTHTPVPAGNDAFPLELIDRYIGPYAAKLGVSKHDFFGMGRLNQADGNEPFGMTVLALRMAWHCNGVSKLHGEVSRNMWQRIWPDVPAQEIPINSITNGVHTQTWMSDEFAALYNRYLGGTWSERPTDHTIWNRVDRIPDSELWRSHERKKERLVLFVRQRVQQQLIRRGMAMDVHRVEELLDAEILTIGFARRFATYKRATLLLRNPERLYRLLSDRDRPIQFVFAGKAHPRDDGGKRFIQDIAHFCRREEIRPRMAFIEDYDMNVARYLTQGVDVWLNTPRRPLEASGTSGMKGPINGAMNLSVLDGWWCEAINGQNGWAVGNGEEYNNDEYQDEIESQALFDVLEREVIPMYYDRGPDGLPRRWIAGMKNSMRTVCSVFNTNRMVQQYLEKYYLPADGLFVKLSEGHGAGATALAQWKTRVSSQWNGVKVRSVEAATSEPMMAGGKLKIFATVELGSVSPDDVRVELYHGLLDGNGNIHNAQRTTMARGSNQEGNTIQYVGSITGQSCGQQGFSIRVLPHNEQVHLRMEPGMIRWG